MSACSWSACAGWAVGLACSGLSPVGVDLELIAPQGEDFVRDWFTAGETAYVHRHREGSPERDLATTLVRDSHHHVDQNHPFKRVIADDPVFDDIKMIAEPWDMGPFGYQVGRFGRGWSEWNDRYRDDVRRFWRGDAGTVGTLATRLAGSADIFERFGRRTSESVNFIAAHDGFTLADLSSLLLIGSLTVILCAMAVRLSTKTGLPSLLLYLGVGMLVDAAGIEFRSDQLTLVLGYAALVLILIEGGLTTSWGGIRRSVAPAALLSTVGVVVSVAVVALAGRFLLGWSWSTALLVAAIVSSTDAAAVFSVLRAVPLPRRLTGMLEAESGFNDAPVVILVTALAGSTALHSAIIVLFFVILAHLADALRLHLADAAALASLRRHGRTRNAGSAADLNALVADEIAARPSSRLLRLVADWVARSGGPESDAGPLSPAAAQDGFHRAARQFARGLVPFLPLLGFLGTVVGLAAAMAELPQGLGAGGGGADIAASLAGLAIKFETTLLGLIGSIVASLLIAIMERRETELAAEARRVVGALVATEAVRHG